MSRDDGRAGERFLLGREAARAADVQRLGVVLGRRWVRSASQRHARAASAAAIVGARRDVTRKLGEAMAVEQLAEARARRRDVGLGDVVVERTTTCFSTAPFDRMTTREQHARLERARAARRARRRSPDCGPTTTAACAVTRASSWLVWSSSSSIAIVADGEELGDAAALARRRASSRPARWST